MSEQHVLIEQVESTQAECRHHWIIDTPAGPVSRGVCKLCGEAREFRNFLEGGYWEDDVNLHQLAGGSRYAAEGPLSKQVPAEEE